MLLVITYDVNTASPDGARRLRKVANLCLHYGVRVQNSVFEVLVDAAQFTTLKHDLQKVIDAERDSIRFYKLGNSFKNKIDTLGKTAPIQSGEPLLLYPHVFLRQCQPYTKHRAIGAVNVRKIICCFGDNNDFLKNCSCFSKDLKANIVNLQQKPQAFLSIFAVAPRVGAGIEINIVLS